MATATVSIDVDKVLCNAAEKGDLAKLKETLSQNPSIKAKADALWLVVRNPRGKKASQELKTKW